MDADRYSRLKRIFFEASSRDADEREAFVDEACRDDPELRSQVHDLLQTAGPLTPHLAGPDLPAVDSMGAGDRMVRIRLQGPEVVLDRPEESSCALGTEGVLEEKESEQWPGNSRSDPRRPSASS